MKNLLESLLPLSEQVVDKLLEHTILYEDHNREMLPPTNNTLYAALIPVEKVLDEVQWWVGQNELIDKVIEVGGKFYDKQDYHTTLVYSKTAGQDTYEYLQSHREEILANATANFKEIEFFGCCCVITLDSPYLQALVDTLKGIGVTSDFPDYSPHITLFKLPEELSVEDKAWFDEWRINATLPTTVIEYDNLNTAPLDEDWG